MLFKKDLLGNSKTGLKQWEAVQARRNAANVTEKLFANALRAEGLQVNQGLIPKDVYQDFDNVTVTRMRSDDGDTFLNDLMGLSNPISLGKLTHLFRQASDAGNAQSSMTGQIGAKMDQVEYKYDGSIVPVHDAGFYRNWREFLAMQSEGFDALIDDQRETVATLRRHLVDNFLDGHRNPSGTLISVDNISWGGVRHDSRVNQVDLGAGGISFDFTDQTKTGAEIKAAFIQLRDVLWITNNCEQDATYYMSRDIISNFERKFSTSYESRTILDELATLQGVAAIKPTSKLVGNELMAFPLDQSKIRPLVGMGVNTVAMPRPVYNSNYEFVTWSAVGYEVRTDYFGKSCVMYAAG